MEDIKLLKENHFAEALTLWEASVRATHSFLEVDDVEFYKPYVKQYLESAVIHCIVSANNKLLTIMGVTDGMIDILFVHPDNFGSGYGRKMVDFAIYNLAADRVDVNEQNTDALAFYLKSGFGITGRSDTDGFGKPYPILHLSLTKE